MFFFLKVVGTIHQNFPTLFDQKIEETEATEGIRESNGTGDGINNEFGILPFILMFCEITNHTFAEAMDYDVNTVFYVTSYQVQKLKKDDQERKRMMKK